MCAGALMMRRMVAEVAGQIVIDGAGVIHARIKMTRRI